MAGFVGPPYFFNVEVAFHFFNTRRRCCKGTNTVGHEPVVDVL
jgi:hypothetical protein